MQKISKRLAVIVEYTDKRRPVYLKLRRPFSRLISLEQLNIIVIFIKVENIIKFDFFELLYFC